MRFAKSVALAIIFGATLLGGPSVYAEDTHPVEQASDAHAKQTEQPKKQTTIEVTVASGDSLSKIAEMNGVSVEALAAENGIANVNLIESGQVLKVTKTEGTDSDKNLTDFYGSLKAAAEAFIEPPAPAPVVVATVPSRSTAAAAPVVSSQATSSAGNSYGWGTCTWYVKERKPGIPNRLGNGGYGWLQTAAAAGYGTGTTPVAGAIGVQSGHVVVVEAVNADGTVSISEMNYAGGLGRVHYRTVSASTFQYIYA